MIDQNNDQPLYEKRNNDLGQPVEQLPCLTEAERQQILGEWNATQVSYPPEPTLTELFAQQAQAHPDVLAVSSAQGQMSYGELERRANQLAHYLCELGVGPETLVGVCMERSLELLIGLLGILKAGGAYVPLDPSYPRERLHSIVQDAGMMLILAHRSTSHRLESQNTSVQIVCWEDLSPHLEQEASRSPQSRVKAHNLAYVIYTSGSTGKPKGVAIQHQSTVTLLHWSSEVVTDEDLVGIVASTSICFDLSVFELFVSLSRGGTVILVEDALHISTVAHERPVLINIVPSVARVLLDIGAIPASVRTICLAGEALSGSLVRALYQGTEVQRIYNLYGPSEDTTYSTYALIPPEEPHPPIGHPIAHTRAYILDQHFYPVPPGATGELYLAGAGLARGYLNRPAMTAEAFLPDPWGQEPGERLYRTGDLARYRADGMLEYRGRRDHQVKLRGFRIELGEIESALRSQEEVQEVVVETREVVLGEQALVAYVIPQPGQQAHATLMRQRLQTVLPAYMIPSFFVLLDAFPLNVNGKLDRQALPAPEGTHAEGEKSSQAARTSTEQILSLIWSEMFGGKRIGIDDDFFELGGHSLLAMIMLSRTRERLQVDLSLQAFFASRTIRQMAQALDTLPRNEAEPVLQSVSHQEPLAVSFAQQRLWFLEQLEPGMMTYHVPLALHLRGSLKWDSLQSSLASLIERHEILRTTFVAQQGQPMQCVAPSAAISLPLVDLSALAQEQREPLAYHLARQEAQRLFDLQQGPLLRVLLFRLATEEHLLVLTLHHIITDGWSEGILWRELAVGYEAAEQGQRPAFAPLPVQYADYALWQRQWLSEERMHEHLAYWQQQLAGAPLVLELPTTQPRPLVQRHQGATIRQQIPTPLHRHVQAVSQREGVTLFMTLFSAFAVVIHRMSGQEDLLLGTVIAGRTRRELEGLIGFFANTLPLRCTFEGNPSGRDFLRQVREMALQAYAHQDVPFEHMVEALQPERDLSRNPLVQVFCTFEDLSTQPSHFGTLVSASVHQVLPTTHFDLTLFVTEQQGELWLTLEYDTDLFTEASMQRLLAQYQMVLEHLVSDVQQPVELLPWLAEAEQRQILEEWNATRMPYPQEHTLGALFTQQAQAHPDALAVSGEQGQMSYGELERRANQLAHYLHGLGVGPETLVGLCLERSLEWLIGVLGILKAGGGYVPLDPAYPLERLTLMLADTRAPIVLTQQVFSDRLPHTQGQMICLDQIWEELAHELVVAPVAQTGASNVAYVMYTSGSTGQAKGVVISHQAIARLVFQQTYSRAGFGDRVAHASNVSFDASTFEIWGALLHGGCVTCVTQEILLAPSRLAHFLQEQAISTMFFTTALFHFLAREMPGIFAGLREVLVGGEAIEPHWVRHVLTEGAPERLVNGYGPTECTTFATWYLLRDVSEQTTALPIGAPLANTEVYVLDPFLQPVPVGVPGELYVGGDGLARGYLNRPDLTAERFIPHPFSPQPGARLYRTGDYVCWSEEPGILEFVGRKDHQVKLRGFRVELGEIESVLRSQPEVQEVVVEVREVVPGEKSLVAYVIPEPEQEADAGLMRQRLQTVLPEYMIPAFFVLLDALPLSGNGKLNRGALPLPDRRRSAPTDASVALRNALEEQVARIWSEVLGVESVGVEENFFELGGHSLLATQVISRVREAFQVDIPLRTLFEAPTIGQFVERLKMFHKSRDLPQSWLSGPADRKNPIPLSFAQQRLWFLDQMEPLNSFYNVSTAIQLSGYLHLKSLFDSLHALVSRHEVLRTRFVCVSDTPIQVIDSESSLPLSLISLEALPRNERAAIVTDLANSASHRPFDLASERLVRCLLLRLSSDEHVLVLSLHHIITDGWSQGVLTQELLTLYKAFYTGEQSPLPALSIQYADYAVWQRQWLQGKVLEEQVDYWRTQLAGASSLLELPTDYLRPHVQSYRGSVHSFVVSKPLTETLNTFSHQEGVTLFITLLAAFQILLARYSGQKDIVVGSPIANRTRSETEQLIGFFANTVVLRTNLSSNPTFQQVIHQVREVCLDAYAHQDLPFEKLVEELQPARNLSYHPLFQVLLVLQNAPLPTIEIEGLQGHLFPLDQQTSKFDLSMSISESQGALAIELGYNTDLFHIKTIERLAHHFQILLGNLVQHPTQPISILTLLSKEEHQQVLYAWNATATDFSASNFLHQLVEAQVARTPEAIAVFYDSQQITFAELNRRANGVAYFLRAQGVGPDTLVGIYMERSLELVIGILGVLKAGGAYVPLDPNYPTGRLEFMMANSSMMMVLTQRSLMARLADSSLQVVDIESIPVPGQLDNPVLNILPDHLAYVIYTSGSTGHPKGAMNTHRAVCNRILWMQSEYHLDAHDRLLQKTPISFDVSVWEMFWPLVTGATLVMASPEGHKDPTYLRDVIQQAGITTLQFVPSMLHIFLQEQGIEQCHSLRQVFCGGEALTIDDQNRFFTLFDADLNNLYGPTETAIGVSFWRCQNPVAQSVVPIGHPIANIQLYILDAHLQPVPPRIAGELYIGGRGVGRGYLRDPQKTAAAFIPNPFSAIPGERLYRTGDLARYRPDGAIEFLGRIDHQVKLRGFRIELGEIEAVLLRHAEIQNAVLLVQDNGNGDKYLVAYIVPVQKQDLVISELKRYLKLHLPEHMIPSFFVVLEALPLTANGKLDQRTLPFPDRAQVSANDAYVAPRNTVERLIAQVWREVLGVEHPGINDNFFELGGHSLLATRIMSRLRVIFQRSLPLRYIFEYPDISSLAASIQRDIHTWQDEQAHSIVATARRGKLPLSFAQQRLWFIQQLDAQSSAYNIYSVMHLDGPLNQAALKQSLGEIISRHEALHTIFIEEQDELSQQITLAPDFPFNVIWLPKADRTVQEKQASDIITQELSCPFNLTTGPLFRGHLIVLDEQEHWLLLNMHHIISDGWSLEILMRDMTGLYATFLHGSSSSLPPLPIQYADYAIWQREWLQGEVLERQVAYWKKQLAGAPPLLALTTDHPRPARLSSRGATFPFRMPANLSQQLKALSQREGVTLFMTLLAAFQVLLARYSGQDDILVGTPIAGRAHRDLEEMIGFFANTLVLRTDLSGVPTFQQMLHRVREVVLAADSHQDLPFEKLVEVLQPQRDPGYHPLFQVMFTLRNVSTLPSQMADIQITYQHMHNETAKFDLSLDFEETSQGLAGSLEYRTDLFTEERMRRLSVHLQTLLESIVVHPTGPLGELSLWSDTITLDAEELNALFDL